MSSVGSKSTAGEDEAVVSFSAEEMLSISTLFLLIDRADKGWIAAADLVAWAAEMTGYDVSPAEAERVMVAIDLDKDSRWVNVLWTLDSLRVCFY